MSQPSRGLSSNSTIEALRREAKRWLKQIRAGDPAALARFNALMPGNTGNAVLRTVQQALARDHGHASWAALKQELADRDMAARRHDERVALFLEKSAIRYGVTPGTQTWGQYEADRPARGAMARRLLARHPEIARDSIHAAVAADDIDAVRDSLATDPALARAPGGLDGWTPLLRLAFTRLSAGSTAPNALGIARLLLDSGASASDYWSDGSNHFTVLTGVIGGGEGRQPPHPQAEPLARLLFAHGADPLDGQALYNTSLGGDDTHWLDLLWTESDKRGETARWRQKVRELPGPPLDYLLGNAVPGQPKRAAWLLAHGADPEAQVGHTKRSVLKHATINGCDDIAEALIRSGAKAPTLTNEEAFVAAIARGDEAEARRRLDGNPAYLRLAAPFLIAIRQGKPAVAKLALALGVSADAESRDGVRALHEAAWADQSEIVQLLVDAGAEVDATEKRFGSTPLGWANHNGAMGALDTLAAVSEDICGLCNAARLERLRQLLAQDRSRARLPTRAGEPPLFALPDNDERALEVAEILLAAGADPTARGAQGLTPAQAALRRGLPETAALLDPDGDQA